LHEVGAVETGSFDPDEELTGRRCRIGPLADRHLPVFDHDGSHDLAL
jgi:hypothetical protein